jgi:hypothetical protein
MSRYTTAPGTEAMLPDPHTGVAVVVKQVNYGFDHALGYWYDAWADNSDDDDLPLVERCSQFDGLSGARLVEALDELHVSVPSDHFNAAITDRPF